jgi:hypothetical protein
MKNKSTMLLLGIGVVYLLYRLYAKKSTAPVNTTASAIPTILNNPDNHNILTAKPFNPYLVDTINTAELVDMPSIYQTYYGNTNVRINGAMSKVPSTC